MIPPASNERVRLLPAVVAWALDDRPVLSCTGPSYHISPPALAAPARADLVGSKSILEGLTIKLYFGSFQIALVLNCIVRPVTLMGSGILPGNTFVRCQGPLFPGDMEEGALHAYSSTLIAQWDWIDQCGFDWSHWIKWNKLDILDGIGFPHLSHQPSAIRHPPATATAPPSVTPSHIDFSIRN